MNASPFLPPTSMTSGTKMRKCWVLIGRQLSERESERQMDMDDQSEALKGVMGAGDQAG